MKKLSPAERVLAKLEQFEKEIRLMKIEIESLIPETPRSYDPRIMRIYNPKTGTVEKIQG
jgi:hypothetical protein